MNSSNYSSYLTLIHPDDTEHPITPVSNGSFEFRNSDYISSEIDISDDSDNIDKESVCDDLAFHKKFTNLYDPISPIKIEIINNNLSKEPKIDVKDKIGDGKMEYIKNKLEREMYTNAWNAITLTNNWDFVAQNIENFAFSTDPRIYEITEKMEELGYNGHSGVSFSLTMRSMQYLVKYGEEKFKTLC
jgi:hypothetical protein